MTDGLQESSSSTRIRLTLPSAILLSSLLIASALAAIVLWPTYQLVALSDGAVVLRLNVHTGDVKMCVPHRQTVRLLGERLDYRCDGYLE